MQSESSSRPSLPSPWGRLARWAITLVVMAAVVWFAGDTVRQGWRELSETKLSIDWWWVALSAVLYIVGLSPMAVYWWLALRSLGESPRAIEVLRGYYLGHLGKYVPGKALVVVLRTGALVRAGCDMRRVAVSVFLETLTFMAAGGLLAAVLLTFTGDGPATYKWLSLALAVVVGVPISPPVAKLLARRVAMKRAGSDQQRELNLDGINWRLTAAGLIFAMVAWTVVGLSLWSAARAVVPTLAPPWQALPVWIEAVALPVVAGFLSLIPGGLMVRDALQVELLYPAVVASEAIALVVAALWRIVSVASEGGVCAILEATRLYRSRPPSPDDTP